MPPQVQGGAGSTSRKWKTHSTLPNAGRLLGALLVPRQRGHVRLPCRSLLPHLVIVRTARRGASGQAGAAWFWVRMRGHFLWRRVVMGRSRELALTFEASERIVSSAEATGGREQFSPLAHTPQPPTTPGRVKVALREDVGPGSNRLEAERMLRWPGGCCRRFLPRQTVPGLWPNGCCDPVAAAEFQRSSRGRSCPPEAGAGQELPSRGRSRAAAAAATPGRATGDFDGKKRVLTGVNASTKRRSFDGQHALTKLIDVSLGRTRRDFGTFGPSERLCMFFGCR